MNGTSKDYQLAQAHMARTQRQAAQHQLAEELTAEPQPTREGLLSRLLAAIRRNGQAETSEATPASNTNRTRYA